MTDEELTTRPWRVVKHGDHPQDFSILDRDNCLVAMVKGRENAYLFEAAADLYEALRELYDHQNGCPLYKYEKGWNRSMELSAAVLARVEAAA